MGKYILDTLQIYFPWDDDFYTYFKTQGIGTANTKMKALPLIYTDNCESTSGVPEIRRNYVIRPEYFNKTYEELGWIRTDKEQRPIIPAEKIQTQVCFYKKLVEPISSDKPIIKFKIIPSTRGKEEYHLEYSAMSAFGKMYSNWVTLYFTLNDFGRIIHKLSKRIKCSDQTYVEIPIKVEKQQAQREELRYVELPVKYYKFSIGEFRYAFDYLRYNGVRTEIIPSLVYDSTNTRHNNIMKPLIKFGIVHTQVSQGFWQRRPQIVMKIAQPMITTGSRPSQGKEVRKKVKGEIIIDKNYENYFLVDARRLYEGYLQLRDSFPPR